MTVPTSSRVSVSPGGFEQAKLIQECNGSLYNFQSWLCRFGHFPLFMREVVKMVGHLWSWLFVVVVVVVLRGGAFAKFRKATVRFVLSFNLSASPSVCLSALNNSVPTRWILMKFHVFGCFSSKGCH